MTFVCPDKFHLDIIAQIRSQTQSDNVQKSPIYELKMKKKTKDRQMEMNQDRQINADIKYVFLLRAPLVTPRKALT